MSDFNTIVGNDTGSWFIWTQAQVDETPYTDEYLSLLEENSASGEPGRKEATGHSQGIVENSKDMRPRFEELMRKHITKIEGTYNS